MAFTVNKSFYTKPCQCIYMFKWCELLALSDIDQVQTAVNLCRNQQFAKSGPRGMKFYDPRSVCGLSAYDIYKNIRISQMFILLLALELPWLLS